MAQLNLAALYERGRGVKKDYAEAFYWYRLAVGARGNDIRDKARKAVQRLRKRLNREQIAQADARIANWTPVTPEATATTVPRTAVAEAAQPATGGGAADAGYTPPPATDQAPAATVDTAYIPPAQDAAGAAEPPAADVEPTFEDYVAASAANVRRGPDKAADRVGGLARGDRLTVLGKVVDRDWMMVMLEDNTVGYVFAPLIAAAPVAVAAATVAPKARFAEVDFGRYFALVIGNYDYRTLPKLETAVDDAKAVAELLENGYGYDVTLLLNATRADIIVKFDEFRGRLDRGDNLLIYYAGHGIIDYATERGYWLPIDASESTQVSWVSNATITDTLKAMDAKHVMLVVDSCYSGTLTRDIKSSLQSPEFLRRMAKKRARVVLASGGLEPVSDSGGSGHSVFTKAFLDALNDNQGITIGTELFLRIRRQVMLGAPQTPEFSDIRFAGARRRRLPVRANFRDRGRDKLTCAFAVWPQPVRFRST